MGLAKIIFPFTTVGFPVLTDAHMQHFTGKWLNRPFSGTKKEKKKAVHCGALNAISSEINSLFAQSMGLRIDS